MIISIRLYGIMVLQAYVSFSYVTPLTLGSKFLRLGTTIEDGLSGEAGVI